MVLPVARKPFRKIDWQVGVIGIGVNPKFIIVHVICYDKFCFENINGLLMGRNHALCLYGQTFF